MHDLVQLSQNNDRQKIPKNVNASSRRKTEGVTNMSENYLKTENNADILVEPKEDVNSPVRMPNGKTFKTKLAMCNYYGIDIKEVCKTKEEDGITFEKAACRVICKKEGYAKEDMQVIKLKRILFSLYMVECAMVESVNVVANTPCVTVSMVDHESARAAAEELGIWELVSAGRINYSVLASKLEALKDIATIVEEAFTETSQES